MRKQPEPWAVTFWTSATETFKISALPWSAVWSLDVHELAGPRASGNVRRTFCDAVVEKV